MGYQAVSCITLFFYLKQTETLTENINGSGAEANLPQDQIFLLNLCFVGNFDQHPHFLQN